MSWGEEIPEFNPYGAKAALCRTKGCIKQRLKGSDLCLDCETEKLIPYLHAELDEITRSAS